MGLPMRPRPMNPTVCRHDGIIESAITAVPLLRRGRWDPQSHPARGAFEQEREILAQHVALLHEREAGLGDPAEIIRLAAISLVERLARIAVPRSAAVFANGIRLPSSGTIAFGLPVAGDAEIPAGERADRHGLIGQTDAAELVAVFIHLRNEERPRPPAGAITGRAARLGNHLRRRRRRAAPATSSAATGVSVPSAERGILAGRRLDAVAHPSIERQHQRAQADGVRRRIRQLLRRRRGVRAVAPAPRAAETAPDRAACPRSDTRARWPAASDRSCRRSTCGSSAAARPVPQYSTDEFV